MSGLVEIDISVEAGGWPAEAELQELADDALGAALVVLPALTDDSRPSPLPGPPPQGGREEAGPAEVSILFTDDAAIRRLNAQYRGQDKATNVLSFPQPSGPHSGPLLGDIILAFETVSAEAALAGKPLKAHMAHLVIHGFLHLLGYDHEGDAEAETMEALERAALERMGITDPYAAAQAT